MPGVFVGDTKALVFPMMSDGYINMPYTNTNAADTVLALREGIWGQTERFTIEAIVTPYDINGYGRHTGEGFGQLNSEKTPPSLAEDITANVNHYQSYQYFGTTRLTRKMMIFHNTNFQLYLENVATSNINRPAEYKLVAKFPAATSPVSKTVETDTIIQGLNTLHGYYDADGYYNSGVSTNLTKIATEATNALPYNTITIDSNSLGVDTDSVAATGTISFDDDVNGNYPEAYYPWDKATATIAAVSDFLTSELDTFPVREIAKIMFESQPNVATNASTDCIAITNEAGTVTKKFFCTNAQPNGTPVAGTTDGFWFRLGTTVELTIKMLIASINTVGFFAGDVTYGGTEPNNTVGEDDYEVCQLKAAFTGTAPNRLGGTSADTADGGIFIQQNSTASIGGFAGGIDEAEVADNYISINSGTNTKKYMPYKDISDTLSPDVNYPDTGETFTRRNGTIVIAFRVGDNMDETFTQLASAIHTGAQSGQLDASYSNANNLVTITKDVGGASGNATGAITNSLITSGRITTNGNFTGGRNANKPHEYLTLTDSANNAKRFHPTRQDYSPTINNGDEFTYENQTYIAFRLGGAAHGNSQNTTSNLMAAVNATTNSSTFDMSMSSNTVTQGTVGAAGNKTITIDDGDAIMNDTTVAGFSNGADGTVVDNYVQIVSADGATTIKYKAASLAGQTTGSASGGYTYFQIGGDTTATANNLITAINDTTNGHGSKITASNPSSNNVVKVQIEQAGSSYATTDNYANITTDSTWSTSGNTVISAVTMTNVGVGESIYDANGALIGTVAIAGANNITLAAAPANTVTSVLYASQPREALYMDNFYKLSCVFNKSGKVQLYVNNATKESWSGQITIPDLDANDATFEFDPSDCRIGQSEDKTDQFFGELYEICMTNKGSPSVTSSTLSPGYNDIIFYYRFGDF